MGSRRLLAPLLALSLAGAAAAHDAGATSFPAHFESIVVATGLTQPVDLLFLDDGRMLVAERRGKVELHDGQGSASSVVIDLEDEICHSGDRGLLGLALHPGFLPDGGATSWLYLLYTVSPVFGEDPFYDEDEKYSFGRLTRYRVDTVGGKLFADLGTRQVLLGNQLPDGTVPDAIPTLHSSHAVGSLLFGADGTLLVTTGDSASFAAVDVGGQHPGGFESFVHPDTGLHGPLSDDQDCGALRAQDLRNLAGKVLRLDPETGLGLDSNPFWDGDPASHASRVWALGLRNPYRAGLVPGTGSTDPAAGDPGLLLVGDVGWQDWEEIDLCAGGENFGWPCFEGNFPEPGYENETIDPNPFGFPTCADAPVGVLTQPLLSWDHSDPSLVHPAGLHVDENGVPQAGFAGGCAVAAAPYPGGDYPGTYDGALFVADYAADWIRALRLDAQGQPVEIADFAFGVDLVVDVETHPLTGDLHYVSLGPGGANGDVHRVRYGANLTPVAQAQAAPMFGDLPLAVTFDASASSDPEGDPLTYTWDFGDGSAPEEGPVVQHTYTATGLYDVVLTVEDDGGLASNGTLQIAAGNVPPKAEIVTPLPGQLFAELEVLELSGTGTDFGGEDLSYEWAIDLYHETHIHPEFAVLRGPAVSFPTESHGDASELVYMSVVLTVRNESGLSGSDHVFVYPETNLFDTTGTMVPITRVQELVPPYPLGNGNPDPEVMRDAELPPVGSGFRELQFDTFHDGDQGDDDWVGFELVGAPFQSDRFTSLVFQEGLHQQAGGWFESFSVEVRDNGVWQPVENLRVTPPYPFELAQTPGFDGVSFETYELQFDPEPGDAIRLRGDPGGATGYISVGELRVRRITQAPDPGPWVDHTPEASVVSKVATLSPPGPQGEGNTDPAVLTNGTQPVVGTDSQWAQIDTFHFGDQGSEDWVGLAFPGWRSFTRVLFQEGFHYPNGGWFQDLAVEVRADAGAPWTPVTGLVSSTPVPGDTGPFGTYETFDLTFDPAVGREIRVVGTPGGSDGFISVAELRAYGPEHDPGACGFSTYGEGLGGNNLLALDSQTVPLVGAPVVLEIGGAPPGAAGTLFLSSGTFSLPALGGTLLVNPFGMTLLPFSFDGAGSAEFVAPLPSNPAFAGSTFHLQAVAPHPVQLGQLLFSNGLSLQICP